LIQVNAVAASVSYRLIWCGPVRIGVSQRCTSIMEILAELARSLAAREAMRRHLSRSQMRYRRIAEKEGMIAEGARAPSG
jgi:hypothetical protein